MKSEAGEQLPFIDPVGFLLTGCPGAGDRLPSQELLVTDSLNLTVKNGELCIPPAFIGSRLKVSALSNTYLKSPASKVHKEALLRAWNFQATMS